MVLQRISSLPLRLSSPDALPTGSASTEPATCEQLAPQRHAGPPGLPLRRTASAPSLALSEPAREARANLAPRRELAVPSRALHAPPQTSSHGVEASLVDIEPADDAARRDLTGPEPAAPGVPSHRDLNPIFSFSSLKVRLPQDVEGCVAYMLSSMGGRVGDTTALAARQAATLRAHGIDDRDKFVALLSNVSWRDYGTSMLHGMASGSGFAIGGAAVDWAAAQGLGELVAEKLPHLSPTAVGLVAGSALGFALSVMDVGAGASARKSFGDAYFTRPPEDRLPDDWRGRLPQHTRASLANDMQASAGLSYGAARNGMLRVPISVGLEATGRSALRSTIDNVIDPVGGDIIGAGGMRLGLNVHDEGAGRAGLQHFLARNDLDQCLDFLERPVHAQVGTALARLARHVGNVGTTLPQATLDAFASKVGWVSHAVLSPGFGGVFAIIDGMPGALAARGLSKNAANVCTQLTKFAALQCLYQGWGGALGATAAVPGARPRDVEGA